MIKKNSLASQEKVMMFRLAKICLYSIFVFFSSGTIETKALEYRLFPSEFDKVFSFVSDADSQIMSQSRKAIEFLNSLGLSLPSSVFSHGHSKNTKTTSFFKGYKTDPQNSLLDTFEFDLLVDWHAGLYDHFHGLYDLRVIHEVDTEQLNLVNRETDLLKLFLADTKAGDLAEGSFQKPFDLSYWAENYFSVLRIYFNQSLSADTRITITTPKNIIRTNPVYTNKIQKKVNDNGRFSWMLSLPVGYNLENGLTNIQSREIGQKKEFKIFIDAPECRIKAKKLRKNCDLKVIRVETGAISRDGIKKSLSWLKEFGVEPTVITHHGGDLLSSMSPVSHVDKTWKAHSHTIPSLPFLDAPIAGYKGSKSYILDLLEDFGVRSIRAFTSDKQQVMTLYPSMTPELVREFGNTISIQTDWMKDTKVHDGVRTFDKSLNLDPNISKELLEYKNCHPWLSGWIGASIGASLRSVRPDHPIDIWYNHFAAHCSDDISAVTNWALLAEKHWKMLAENMYGVSSAANDKSDYRLWVVPPTAAQRLRILKSELDKLQIELDRQKMVEYKGLGNIKQRFKQSKGPKALVTEENGRPSLNYRKSSFFDGENFPRKNLESHDLNGFSIKVTDDLLTRSPFETADLNGSLSFRNIGGEKWLTFLDTTNAVSVLSEVNRILEVAPESKRKQKNCFPFNYPYEIYNTLAFGFSSKAPDLDEIDLEFEFRSEDQKTKSTIFAYYSNPEKELDNYFEISPIGIKQEDSSDSYRYLTPVFHLKNPSDNLSNAGLPFGKFKEVCIKYHSEKSEILKLSDLRIYSHNTSVIKPGVPFWVGGKIFSDTGEIRLVRAKFKNSEWVYAKPDMNGIYWLKIGQTKKDKFGFDQAMQPRSVQVELINDKNEVQDVASFIAHSSEFRIDLSDRD